MVTTLLALFFLDGAGGAVTPQATTVIGRRRRTRRYRAPLPVPAALEQGYPELRSQASREDLRAILKPYLLSGEYMPVRAAPRAADIDWEALSQDVIAVRKLLDLWSEIEQEEDDLVLMMSI